MLTDEQIKQKWTECVRSHRRGDVISSVDMAIELARWVEAKTTPAPTRDVCRWMEEPNGEYWHSDCGNDITFEDSAPDSDGMKWCCYCGKPLQAAPFDHAGDDAG